MRNARGRHGTWTRRAVGGLALLAGAIACVGAPVGCAKRFAAPSANAVVDSGAKRDRALALAEQAQQAERRQRPDEAIALYRKAIESDSGFPGAWNNLGCLLTDKGEMVEAVNVLKTAADLAPSDPRPVYNIGVIWEKRGYYDDAARYYLEALARDESYKPALRSSIFVDQQHRRKTDEATAQRLKRALLLEDDPRWLAYFERQRTQLEQTAPTMRDSLGR